MGEPKVREIDERIRMADIKVNVVSSKRYDPTKKSGNVLPFSACRQQISLTIS